MLELWERAGTSTPTAVESSPPSPWDQSVPDTVTQHRAAKRSRQFLARMRVLLVLLTPCAPSLAFLARMRVLLVLATACPPLAMFLARTCVLLGKEVAVLCHPIGQGVDTVAQAHHAALQGGDGLCRLPVAGDDAELFADCAKLERMHQHRMRILDSVLLGQHDGLAVLVVHDFGAQVVVRQFVGHGAVFQCVVACWRFSRPVKRCAGFVVGRL